MKLIVIFSFTLLVGCSSTPSKPSLYPNETFNAKGSEKANADVDECLAQAQAYLKTPEGEKLKKSDSSLSTSVGMGFGMGPNLGIGFGVGNDRPRISSEERARRNFTAQCLSNKGYQIIGWD